jgi:hypothetical protein
MFKRFKWLIKLWRLRGLEQEVRALEKYGNRSDPKVLATIQRGKQVLAQERAS